MFIFKLLFFTLFIYTTYGSESSEEIEALLTTQTGAHFLRYAIKKSYEENKIDLLSPIIKAVLDHDFNLTLVGTQNIYGPNGELLEIRTVELHQPQFVKESDDNKDDDDDDENSQQSISEIKKISDDGKKLGFSVDVASEEYNKDGEITEAKYIDHDVTYSFSEGLHSVNETIYEVNTTKTVEDYIRILQRRYSPVAVHKFNAKGELVYNESAIVPEYIVSIVNDDIIHGSDDGVDLELLEIVKKGLATVFLKSQNDREEIPSKLAKYLSLKYPGLDFFVFLNEPQGWYLAKKNKIKLRVDFDNWESSEELIYTVIVQEKK